MSRRRRRSAVSMRDVRAARLAAERAERIASQLEKSAGMSMKERVTLKAWAHAVASKRFRAIVAHPHHYATAAGLTVFFACTGHFEVAAVLGAWGYAFVENLASAADDK